MQHWVGFEIVAGHAGLLVNAHHFPVLSLRQFEVETGAGLMHVLQRAPDQRPGFDPLVIVRLTQQHIAQHAVVVVDPPIGCLIAHEIYPTASDVAQFGITERI
jgi:hypothetical protein